MDDYRTCGDCRYFGQEVHGVWVHGGMGVKRRDMELDVCFLNPPTPVVMHDEWDKIYVSSIHPEVSDFMRACSRFCDAGIE